MTNPDNMHTNIIARHDTENIAIITLSSPKNINALSEEMLNALSHMLDDIKDDNSIKAVILRSNGAHFCAGHNLKEMSAKRNHSDGGYQYFQDLFALCSAMMLRIVHLPQPVIAEVKGIATAAGCQLVASCDLAVAADDAKFATSGVNIGLFCSTPMVALSRNIARKMAMEMLLLGEFVTAPRACELGLVNRVTPLDNLEETTMDMARLIASKSAKAVKIGKKAFYQQLDMPLDKAYAFAGQVMAKNMMAQDATHGINAFIDKQPMPQWRNK